MKKIIVLLLLFLIGCSSYSIPEKNILISEKYNIYHNHDEFENKDLYLPKAFFYYGYDAFPVLLYITKKNNLKVFRMVFQHYGSDWIFFYRAILVQGNNKLDLSFNTFEKKTDFIDGNIKEKIDIIIDNYQFQIIKNMVEDYFSDNGKIIKLKLIGKYYLDKELKEDNIRMLRDVVEFSKSI